jgi:predicted ester cyclase
MTTQEIINLNKAVIDSWNSHDTEKFLSLCDKNIVWKDTASPEPFRGLEGARTFFEMWSTAFPDFKLTLRNTVANETNVAGELEFSGTNTGTMTMPGQQPMPATHER